MDDFWRHLLTEISSLQINPMENHLIVGIDGVDGSGKTQFARKLAEHLHSLETPIISQIILVDDFHNVREIRHRQGRDSSTGYFEDSFDYESLTNQVLKPLKNSAGKNVAIVPKAHDLQADLKVYPDPITVEPGCVVILEGIFLQRDELVKYLDFKIFLDVPFQESVRRMSLRDGSVNDPEDVSLRRYIEGQKLYFQRCSPREKADLVVDNSNFDAPIIVSSKSYPEVKKNTSYQWIREQVPTDLVVRQVYAYIFDSKGRILIFRDGEEYNLPGGTPESGETMIETLVREVAEEVQVTIKSPSYLGYQLVTADTQFAQVRFAATLDKELKSAVDPCTGRMYERLWVHPNEANEFLGWGISGDEQISDAERPRKNG